MTFTSLTFVLFLCLVFSAHWQLKTVTARNALLLVASYCFYGWWDYRFCLLMLATTAMDYRIARLLSGTVNPAHRRLLLLCSLTFNLGVLGVFKYFNFFAESFSRFLELMGASPSFATLNVLLPVGISFYTFQSLSYVIDVYSRRLPAEKSFLTYAAYISLFPQLVAGPIERASHLLPQIRNPRVFDGTAATDGLRLILWGFIKKVIVADTLGVFVDAVYSDPGAFAARHLILATVFFAFQIYCDFSAYSDIARGTAALFGISLMRNFNFPYFSRSPVEFWRRWHISLSTWFRDYVYIPLGGNRVSPSRHALNILITFGLSGLWHGAAWTFVFWGLLNGLAVLPYLLSGKHAKEAARQLAGSKALLPSVGQLAAMGATFTFVCVCWVFFRANTLADALLILGTICQAPFTSAQGHTGMFAGPISTISAMLLVSAFVCFEWLTRNASHPLEGFGLPRELRWAAYLSGVCGIVYFAPATQRAFIYFQF